MFSSSSRLRGFFSTISRKVASLNTIKAGTFCLPASHLRRAYRAFSSFSSASLSGAAPAVDLVRIYRNAGFPVICTSAETACSCGAFYLAEYVPLADEVYQSVASRLRV